MVTTIKTGALMSITKNFTKLIHYGLFAVVVVLWSFWTTNTYADILPDIIRISIPLNQDNDYRIVHKDKKLDINFTKPIRLKKDLTAKISDIIHKQQLSTDSKSLSFELQIPLTVSGRRNHNKLLIELIPQNSTRRYQKKIPISLNIATTDNNSIFTFAPASKVLYTINTSPSYTTIYFLTPVDINVTGAENYPHFSAIRQTPNAMGGTNYEIPSRLLKAGESGKNIVLEVTQPNSTSSNNKQNNNENPYQETLDNPNKEIVSLSFPWNTATGAAIFERGEHLWIAFDNRKKLDTDEIARTTTPLVTEVLEIPHTKGTVLRLRLQKDVYPQVRREGLLWIVDLYKGKSQQTIKDAALFTQYNASKHPYFYIPSNNSGNILSVVDPEVGDNINIAPLSDIGTGISSTYEYPDLTFLRSIQGIALVPNTSNLKIERGNTGIVISAEGRGLNISADLDYLRRQHSLSHSIAPTQAFDFKVPSELSEKSYSEALEILQNDINTAPSEQKDIAKLNLAKYYISMGIGAEASSILNELNQLPSYKNTEAMHTLLGVADFLSRRYNSAINHFSAGQLVNNDEAIFWKTISASAISNRPENNAILISFISLIKDYPQALKDRIASIGAITALAAGDDISTQNFIDILKQSPYQDLYRQAEISYLDAMRRSLQGYPRNAIRTLKEIGITEDNKHSAMSRFESARLSNRLGFLPLAQTIDTMERIYFVWGEKQFRLMLLKTLAELYTRNNDYYSAMKKLNQSLSLENEDERASTLKRMVTTFEEIYINNRADNMPILKSLALYQDFEWLAPQSKHFNEIVQRLADRLVAVDLIPRARQLLSRQLKYGKLTDEERSKTGTRLALINLFEENPADALEVLNATEYQDISDSLQMHRKIIRAKTLAELGHIDEAIALLEDDYSKNALLMKSEIYWKNQEWAQASDTIRYLVEQPKEGEKLSDEQIYYILDWATALNMAGKTPVLLRLRNKFMPYFENTKHYSTFSILTSNLEYDTIDLNAINQVINDTSAFSNFTKIYNESLKNNSLSETIK